MPEKASRVIQRGPRKARCAGRQPNVPAGWNLWWRPRHESAVPVVLCIHPICMALEVLRMLAAGRSNQAIAADLVVALDTVKKHVSHLLDKLGATNRTEAVARAREIGRAHV